MHVFPSSFLVGIDGARHRNVHVRHVRIPIAYASDTVGNVDVDAPLNNE